MRIKRKRYERLLKENERLTERSGTLADLEHIWFVIRRIGTKIAQAT